MSKGVWYSQLFDCDGAGVMLALPYEVIAEWSGSDGENYDEVIDECSLVHFQPLGSTFGLFVGDFDGNGVHESHWMRLADAPDLILVVWSEWSDPSRKYGPEDPKKVARAWERGEDPRQSWLEERLRRGDLEWQRHAQPQNVSAGVLLLLHAEWPARKARLPKPNAIAKCGQVVPVGLAPGRYFLETVEINELPAGEHLCALCRWVRSEEGH